MNIGARRTSNGYLPDAVSNAEVLAWARLHRVRLTTFEMEALDELERIYLAHHAAKAIERAAAKK